MPDIVDWPQEWLPWTQGEFSLTSRSQRSVSPWTQRNSVYGPHAQYWIAKFVFPQKRNALMMQREALLENLGGSAGLLRISHPLRCLPQYTTDVTRTSESFSDGSYFNDGSGWVGGPLPATITCVGSASMGEKSVLVGGLPESRSRVLRPGDLVEFRRDGIADETPSLHRVFADLPTDASGEGLLQFIPPLRKGLASGDMVVLSYPTGVFRLVDDNQGGAQWNNNIGSHAMSLVEALI